MIPTFPDFKKLEITDKKEVEDFTQQFPPYSDFNFVSMYSWDIDDKVEIALMNNNLVIKFQDYITKQLFYSLLGINSISETITTIFSQLKKTELVQSLQLVPDVVARLLGSSDQLKVKEDLDNFDYILSIKDLITLGGNKFRGKRNFVNRFKKLYASTTEVKELDINENKIKNEIKELFLIWERISDRSKDETENEFKAVNKLLNASSDLNLNTTGVYINNVLKGFSINEVVQDNYGVIHYEKADISVVGIFQYLKQQTSIILDKHGCKFINYEQDLGIEGLRKAKQSYQPIDYLKKYTITPK